MQNNHLYGLLMNH